MKFLLIAAAVVAVAVAGPTQRIVTPGAAGPAPVIDYEPIAIGPAIVDSFEPIAIGPAIIAPPSPVAILPEIIDFPVADVGTAVDVVDASPAIILPAETAPASPAAAPLVQIILNINQPNSQAPAPVTPEVVVEPQPEPVNVVDTAPVFVPLPVVIPSIPEPVVVVDSAPEPVVVVDSHPVFVPLPVVLPPTPEVVVTVPEPVIVAEPSLPSPAVSLPEILN